MGPSVLSYTFIPFPIALFLQHSNSSVPSLQRLDAHIFLHIFKTQSSLKQKDPCNAPSTEEVKSSLPCYSVSTPRPPTSSQHPRQYPSHLPTPLYVTPTWARRSPLVDYPRIEKVLSSRNFTLERHNSRHRVDFAAVRFQSTFL